MNKMVVVFIISLFAIGAMTTDSNGGSRGQRRSAKESVYHAGKPERSITLSSDKPSRGNSLLRQPRDRNPPGILSRSKPGNRRLRDRSSVRQSRTTEAILRQVLPQAINAGIKLIERRAERAESLVGGAVPPARSKGRRSRRSRPIQQRTYPRAEAGNRMYEGAIPENVVLLDSDGLTPSNVSTDDGNPQSGDSSDAASSSASAENQPESLGDLLAREYFRDVLRSPYWDPASFADLPRTKPEDTPEPLADRLAREDGRLLLDYLNFHEDNVERSKSQLIRTYMQFANDKTKNEVEKNRNQLRDLFMKDTLEYYARELAKLKHLEEDSITFSDWAREKIAERRQEIQDFLDTTSKYK